jgi:hypothetical protein
MHQNDMPPLAGSCRDTCCFHCLYLFSVSRQIPTQITS